MLDQTTEAHDEVAVVGRGIREAMVRLDRISHEMLTLVRRFDELEGAKRDLQVGTAEWLAWATGLKVQAARERVRMARALGELPLIDYALARGEVSFSKVRAMTRVATPENERELLELARVSTAEELECVCRRMRQGVGVARGGDVPSEFLRRIELEDGRVKFEIVVSAERAMQLSDAIDAARRAGDVSAETPNDASAEARDDDDNASAEACPDAVTGMMRLAESFLAHGAKSRAASERSRLFVEVSDAPCSSGEKVATLKDGTRVSAEAFERLTCDCATVPVKRDGRGNVTELGARTRVIDTKTERAVELRDKGVCQVPGCSHSIFTDKHHVVHFARGGETVLENLVTLCDHHHRQTHEGELIIEATVDGFQFWRKRGGRLLSVPEPIGFVPRPGLELEMVMDIMNLGVA